MSPVLRPVIPTVSTVLGVLIHDAQHRARDLAGLKAEVGTCDTAAAIVPTGALAGDFTWNCEHGRVKGQILLAPTPTPHIQSLTFTRSTP